MQKILVIMPQSIGGRLTISSIKDGLNALSVKTDTIDVLKEDETISDIKNYDTILGYDYGAIEFCQRNKIDVRCINYFSDVIDDNHAGADWKEYYSYLKKSNSLTFYWDKELCKKNNDIKNLFYLPHFVNTDIYKNQNSKKEFDIIFTGRLDTDYRLNTFLSLIKSLPNYRFGWFAIEKHYKDALDRLKEQDKHFIKRAYQHFIDNEKDMANVINKARIVINFNEQGISSLNYRTFQTMACETFLISDFRQEGTDYFKNDFIYYTNFDDMVKKTDFYLKNEGLRIDIAKRLRKIIIAEFSHTVGAKKILEKTKEVFDV